jgi:hypothetical protein
VGAHLGGRLDRHDGMAAYRQGRGVAAGSRADVQYPCRRYGDQVQDGRVGLLEADLLVFAGQPVGGRGIAFGAAGALNDGRSPVKIPANMQGEEL